MGADLVPECVKQEVGTWEKGWEPRVEEAVVLLPEGIEGGQMKTGLGNDGVQR